MGDPWRVAFTVPGKPIGKGRARFARATGRAFTPAKTVNYEGLVALAAAGAMGAQPPIGHGIPLRCVMTATFDVPASWSKRKRVDALDGTIRPTSKPDLTNVVKAVEDACNAIVWHDDSQIVDWRIVKRYGETAGVLVEVEAL